MAMLNRQEIKELIDKEQLIEECINLETQLAPNGFDLTAGSVFGFDSPGKIDFSNKERVLPKGVELIPEKQSPEDKFGWWHLEKGAYKIRTNEIVNLPNDLVGLAFTRSSLLRVGAFTQHGVWDAGFKGRGEFILVVDNPQGLQLKQNARVVQIVFLRINHTEQGYQGIHKHL